MGVLPAKQAKVIVHVSSCALTLTPPCLATAHSKSQVICCLSATADDGEDTLARALKRPRLVWTPKLHQRFVEAVEQLGLKVAVPKTIMQVGVPSFASSVLTSQRARVEASFSMPFKRPFHARFHAMATRMHMFRSNSRVLTGACMRMMNVRVMHEMCDELPAGCPG